MRRFKLVWFLLALALFMAVAILPNAKQAWAPAVTEYPWGFASPKWYNISSNVVADYYLAAPTLSADDTAVGLAATQTLTNKTLTGATLTSPKLNEAVAVTTTATELNVLASAGISSTEIAYLNGATAGTQVASKAVVTGSDNKIGAATFDGAITVEAATISSIGNGATVTGITATENGDGVVHKTTLTYNLTGANVLTVTRESGDDSGRAALKVYDFPVGRILVLGVTSSLDIDVSGSANVADAGSGDFSMGTTGTADTTLDGTDVNLCPSTATTEPFVAGIGAADGALAASAQFDGTTTAGAAIDAYLNMIWDAGDVTTGNGSAAITGTQTIVWVNLGDY